MATGPDGKKPKVNPFSGMFEGILTPDTLKVRKQAEQQQLNAQRMAQLGPMNTVSMQFGEQIGKLIRSKAGILSAEERQAASNGEVLAAGLDSAMAKAQEEGMEIGTPEFQRLVHKETMQRAFKDGNLEVANSIHEKMVAEQARQAQLDKLKAETTDIGADNRRDERSLDLQEQQGEHGRRIDEESLDLRREELGHGRQMDAKTMALENAKFKLQRQELAQRQAEHTAQLRASRESAARQGAAALRQEIDAQLEPAAETLEAIGRAERLAAQGDIVGDTGLIFAAMKAFDPGARVTDQDFENVAKAKEYWLASDDAPEEIKQRLENMVITGDVFTAKQRAAIIDAVRATGRKTLGAANGIIDDATEEAQFNGMRVESVLSGRAKNIMQGYSRVSPFTEDQMKVFDGDKGQDALRMYLKDESELNSAIEGL